MAFSFSFSFSFSSPSSDHTCIHYYRCFKTIVLTNGYHSHVQQQSAAKVTMLPLNQKDIVIVAVVAVAQKESCGLFPRLRSTRRDLHLSRGKGPGRCHRKKRRKKGHHIQPAPGSKWTEGEKEKVRRLLSFMRCLVVDSFIILQKVQGAHLEQRYFGICACTLDR